MTDEVIKQKIWGLYIQSKTSGRSGYQEEVVYSPINKSISINIGDDTHSIPFNLFEDDNSLNQREIIAIKRWAS